MKTFTLRLIGLTVIMTAALGNFVEETHADFVEITPSGDVRVLSFFPNSNEGNGSLLSLYNDGGANIQRTYVFFDLTPYAGEIAVDDGEFTLIASSFGAGQNLTNGQLFQVASDWDENTITWNNQPGEIGAPLSTISGDFADESEVIWTIPQSILQTWLDNPLSNHGLVIISSPGSLLGFHSRESNLGLSAPRLGFNTAVPEPLTTLPLLGIVAGLAFLRKSR